MAAFKSVGLSMIKSHFSGSASHPISVKVLKAITNKTNRQRCSQEFLQEKKTHVLVHKIHLVETK